VGRGRSRDERRDLTVPDLVASIKKISLPEIIFEEAYSHASGEIDYRGLTNIRYKLQSFSSQHEQKHSNTNRRTHKLTNKQTNLQVVIASPAALRGECCLPHIHVASPLHEHPPAACDKRRSRVPLPF